MATTADAGASLVPALLPRPRPWVALAFALVGVVVVPCAVIAWLFARRERRRIARGEVQDVGRGWLAVAEALGAVVTTVAAVLVAMIVFSVGSAAFR